MHIGIRILMPMGLRMLMPMGIRILMPMCIRILIPMAIRILMPTSIRILMPMVIRILMRMGIRQYSRALQGIPQEMRTRFIPNSGVGLALWELKKQKKTRKHDAPEMENGTEPSSLAGFGHILLKTHSLQCLTRDIRQPSQ